MMRSILLLLLVPTLLSCGKKQIVHYEYNGVVITRMDRGDRSRFYHGLYQESDKLPKSYIETWSTGGFNGGKWAVMIFRKNNVALYCSAGGSRQVGGESSTLILYNNDNYNSLFEDNIAEIRWGAKISGHYDSICNVSYFRESEERLNRNNNSNVTISW